MARALTFVKAAVQKIHKISCLGAIVMGAENVRNSKYIQSEKEIENLLRLELLECPSCGDTFLPKTAKQIFCKLSCQIDMRNSAGRHRRVSPI